MEKRISKKINEYLDEFKQDIKTHIEGNDDIDFKMMSGGEQQRISLAFELVFAELENVELFSHVANLGDSHSLILHPASTTHRQLSEEQQISAGAGPEVIRLSIGIESVEDIISDLEQALNKL